MPDRPDAGKGRRLRAAMRPRRRQGSQTRRRDAIARRQSFANAPPIRMPIANRPIATRVALPCHGWRAEASAATGSPKAADSPGRHFPASERPPRQQRLRAALIPGADTSAPNLPAQPHRGPALVRCRLPGPRSGCSRRSAGRNHPVAGGGGSRDTLRQNKKYRCAIGSTAIGSQVNSSPSAQTR
jgi:hypothetical protein